MVRLLKTEQKTTRNISAEDVAADLGVSPREARRLLATGTIPGGFRVGRLWRVEESGLVAFKEEQKRKVQQQARRVISTVQEQDA